MCVPGSDISAYAWLWYLSCSKAAGQGAQASSVGTHTFIPGQAAQSLSLNFLKASRAEIFLFPARPSQGSWAVFLGARSSYVKLKNPSALHLLEDSWVRDVKTVPSGQEGSTLSSLMRRAPQRKEEFPA